MVNTLKQFMNRYKKEYGYKFNYTRKFNPNKVIITSDEIIDKMKRDCIKLLKQVAEENDVKYKIDNHALQIDWYVWEFGGYKLRTKFKFNKKTKSKWYGIK